MQMFELLNMVTDPTDPIFISWMQNTIPAEKRVGVLAGFPLLSDLKKRVSQVPAIKEWLEKRPKNEDEPY